MNSQVADAAGGEVVSYGLIFFFFQAEDGIRDYKVTGVQTCALPICIIFGRSVNESREMLGRLLAQEHPVEADIVVPVPDSGVPAAVGYALESKIPFRSEERRVGKECRSRWSPYH